MQLTLQNKVSHLIPWSTHLLCSNWDGKGRGKKGFPADVGSDFKINPFPPPLCSFSEKQPGSKFHLHKAFVARGLSVIYHTREIRRKCTFVETGIMVMKHKKKYWAAQKQCQWLTSTGPTKNIRKKLVKSNKPSLPQISFFFFLFICKQLQGKFIAFHKEEEMPGPAERVWYIIHKELCAEDLSGSSSSKQRSAVKKANRPATGFKGF